MILIIKQLENREIWIFQHRNRRADPEMLKTRMIVPFFLHTSHFNYILYLKHHTLYAFNHNKKGHLMTLVKKI